MPSLRSSTSSNLESADVKREPHRTFNDNSAEGRLARKAYLRVFLGGSLLTILLIFAVFSIFWGSLWHIPSHSLPGWVVDFDGGEIGSSVTEALGSASGSKIIWQTIPASQFPGGTEEVGHAVVEERTWVAITSCANFHFSSALIPIFYSYPVNEGTTQRLSASISSPNASYDGTDAMSVFAVEARNENAFRNIIRPSVQTLLDGLSQSFALRIAQQATSSPNITQLLTISPQTVVLPISYRLINLIPFDIPVASAVTFVGLILQLILSFFVVMMGAAARDASGFDKSLSTRALVVLRMVSAFGAFFIISLFYCLLSVAFQLPVNRKFGQSGFLVFWMLSYVGMLSVGLALESLVALLTPKFIPFFMLTWVIANVSVAIFPIEIMPRVFRYGYGAPFYNISRAMRTVIFGTRNRVGFDFGILIVWIVISCITLPLIQVLVRRPTSRRREEKMRLQTAPVISPNLTTDAAPDIELEEKEKERRSL